MPEIAAPRKRKQSQYRSFKMSKRIKPPIQKKLPSTWSAVSQTAKHMWRNKTAFLGLIAIYVLLNLIFVKGFASTIDIPALKDELVNSGTTGTAANTALLGVLFGSGNAASTEVGTLYQSAILLIVSLATIWLFRFSSGDKEKKISIKQPFYEGMTPLIPFILVLCVLGLQLIPMLAGLGILSTVLSNGLAVTFVEQVLWVLLTLLLSLLTLYLLSSSIFALIIVTLPDTPPIAALRGARKVVQHRRLQMMRKLFILFVMLAALFSILILLCIVIAPGLAEWFFLLLSAAFLPLALGAVYKMYRALL